MNWSLALSLLSRIVEVGICRAECREALGGGIRLAICGRMRMAARTEAGSG
jgi:hypothetical protein